MSSLITNCIHQKGNTMARHLLVVMTNATDGREDEYNDWYNDVHLDEVVKIPEFVSAQRFKLADTQLKDILTPEERGDSKHGASHHRYLALYEIEAETSTDAVQALRQARPNFQMTDALSKELNVWVFSPITGVVESTD